jgi:Fe-S-cluster containining protein
MLTDLVQIRRMGEKQRDENVRLRLHLKRRNFQERRLVRIGQEVEEQIDCTACANCCRVASIRIADRDVEKLARRLGIGVKQFLLQFTREDAEEGRVLLRNEGGCVFLEGNLCSVYDVRPHTCVTFPHLVRGTGSLVSRMWDMPDRACYCPIVYNTLEAWKAEVGFQR